ncbi:putative E3 ubiquitin-protein ligase ARI7 [Apium graveolens]|uniref:putative E3 ubiquitin-protein ligase ARI7 n=1 Tax=Apium graveolens TaxID=4045 RepID=UPI003D791778
MYCTTCLDSYISIAIDEGPGCLSLRCPDPSCNAPFGEDMVNLLASEEHKKKFYQYFVRSYVEGNSNVKWCPAPNCGAAIEYIGDDGKSGGYEVVCGCSFKFCWRCIEDDHRAVECETVAKWAQKTKIEAKNVNWILVHTKPCPKCKRPIQKNKGCMHMTCDKSCGHRFCWTCLGPLGLGSHKCNTYKSKQDDKTKKAESSLKRNDEALLKRYGHYFERWDANYKSRMKAQSDLEKMQETNLSILSEKFGLTKQRLKFVVEAWKQITECRRTLKWSYAYGYYITNHESAKVALFEYLQGQAEAGLERLHLCAEEELMKFVKDRYATADQFHIFRGKLLHLTGVTRDYFANLVTALENDLVESENKSSGKRKNRPNGKKEKRSEDSIINQRNSRLQQDYTYPKIPKQKLVYNANRYVGQEHYYSLIDPFCDGVQLVL